MKLVERIQADYRQNKAIFWLKFIIFIVIGYCGFQLLKILIVDYESDYFSANHITLYPFYIVFMTGVIYLIRLYQISFDKQNPQFKSLLNNVIINFGLSVLLFFIYYISGAVK